MSYFICLLTFLSLYQAAVTASVHCPIKDGWKVRPTTDGSTGICYYESLIEANWEAAKVSCSRFQTIHGLATQVKMASVHSLYENVYIFDNITNKRNAWLGLRWTDSAGDWLWDDGTRLNYELWQSGSAPDDGSQGECVSQASGDDTLCGEWVPADCSIPLPYVCETAAVLT